MFRNHMIIILAAFMVLGTSACTSKKAADESADVEQGSGDESIEAAEATENNNDLATDKSAGDGSVADLGSPSDDLAPDEKLPDDKAAGGDAVAVEQAPSDLGDTPPPPAETAQTDTLTAPPPDASTESPPPAVAETPPPAEPLAPPTPEPVAGESKPVATLQKIKTQPYKDHGILVNAAYLARKGDSPESISQKVFGSKDKVKDLCKVNSYNCSRPVKVGDKFYYNSPQRPQDDTVVKNFYEDAGIAPQIYTAKAGDNIRKVAKDLLGHKDSWKEVWATNEVESKGDLEAGAALKYWPNSEVSAPAQTMAKTEEAAPAPPTGEAQQGEAPPPDQAAAQPPVPDQAANQPPPPPDQQAAQPPPTVDSLPPAPDQNQNAAPATVAPPEPPPPPPPPPVDQAAARKEPAAVDGGGMQDPNQTMALGVGAVLLLAAAALFISIRKKRARRQIDFNTTTQTQIE